MKHDEMNGIEQLTEWEEHQYEPGYWLGKKHPLLRKRPNKLGYLVAVWGFLGLLLMIVVTVDTIRELVPFDQFTDMVLALVYIVIGILPPILFIAAGIAWATPPRKKRGHRSNRH
jgi:uncharacterized membrane protein YdbT with pleckstrin-like domain